MVNVNAETAYRPVDDIEAHPDEGTLPTEAQLHAETSDPNVLAAAHFKKHKGPPPRYSAEDRHPLIEDPPILEAPPRETPVDGPPPAYHKPASIFARFGQRIPLRPFTVVLLLSTIIMWIFTLVINVMHRISFSFAHPFTQSMVPLDIVSSNPASLAANMPEACISYLQTNASTLVSQGLYTQIGDKGISTIFENGQFVLYSLFGLHGTVSLWRLRNNDSDGGETGRISKVLGAYRYLMTLILPLIVVSNTIYLVVTVFGQGGAVNFTFTRTNPLNFTLPNCTFVVVGMDKRFGYFDVTEGLGMRIGQSLLGVA
jgi:hypothetical protein